MLQIQFYKLKIKKKKKGPSNAIVHFRVFKSDIVSECDVFLNCIFVTRLAKKLKCTLNTKQFIAVYLQFCDKVYSD